MARATVFESTQIGVETDPGTRVAALKRLLCTGITINPQIKSEPFRPFGGKAPTTSVPRKEYTDGPIEGVLAYGDIVYLLSSLLGEAEITTPEGATNTRRWTFKPKQWDPDAFKTFSVDKGSMLGASSVANVIVNALTMSFAQDKADISGSVFGKAIVDGVQMSGNEIQTITMTATSGTFTVTFGGQETDDLDWNAAASDLQTALEALDNIVPGDVIVTKSLGVFSVEFAGNYRQMDVDPITLDITSLTGGTATVTELTKGVEPTDIAELPVSPLCVALYVADAAADLATGKLTNALEAELSVSDKYTRLMTLDPDETSFSEPVERAPSLVAKLVLTHGSVAEDMVEDLRSAKKKFMRILASQGEIETGFPYRIQITFPFAFDSNERGDSDDVYASTFPLNLEYDADFGGYLEVVVDNDLTAL